MSEVVHHQTPLWKGHKVNRRHGARDPRVYGELAQLLAAGLLEDRPDLEAYPEEVAAWATLEAQAALMRRHFAEVGAIDPETNTPRSSLSWLSHFEKRAMEARQPLGLSPIAEAKLAKERAAAAHLAVDLEGLAERGRASLAAREHPDLAGQVLEAANEEARARAIQADMEFLI